MPELKNIKSKIIEIGKRICSKDFVASNNGNISCRIDKNKILITPSGVSKGFMKTDDLLIVDMEGKIVDGFGKPSSETSTHLTIYTHRSDVKSICHTHPVFATAFACSNESINEAVLSDVILGLGKIAEVEYALPGSKELSQNLLTFLQSHDAFLLQNHGVITVGNSLDSAYYRTETVEHFAQIHYYARQLGCLHPIKKDQIKKLIDLRKNFNIRKDLNKFE